MTPGERIFWSNANSTFARMGMSHLDPAHGAAVEIVDWCRRMRRRPTHIRQRFLEQESPALLAYFEALDASDSHVAWRTLEDRINRAVQESDMKSFPCGFPWQVTIWLLLPELAAIGQAILDKQAQANGCNLDPAPMPIQNQDDAAGSDGGDKGSGDKTGSAGSTAKPLFLPSLRLHLPATTVVLSDIERKIFDLNNEAAEDETDPNNPVEIEGPDGPVAHHGPIGGNP
ncbi:MAG: hypothetical protein Q8K28_02505 [Hoeflea sp.]|uniref:hypothetical protein n=1 Tax=Hoeflea sp. TaxID=1940281 RepID=UPI00272FA843|nr:hypothetical protein [Hoeflea sp.]MDP2118755.1 hypothetical protein [Hoeflea sp.]